MRTVFAWSYRALPTEAARLFRLLGLHPSAEFGDGAAAALAGSRQEDTRHWLGHLVGSRLLEQTAPDRYEFHDPSRTYAADQARQAEGRQGSDAAVRRLVSWYVHTSAAALAWINPGEPHAPIDPPAGQITPLGFSRLEAAVHWYELEAANLLAAARTARDAGMDRIAWQLPAVLRGIHMLYNPVKDWLSMSHIGLEAARRIGDRTGEAELLKSLGAAYAHAHRLDEAADYHRAGMAVRRRLGDRPGEAVALNDIGLIRLRERRLPEATAHFERGLLLCHDIGAPRLAAATMSGLAEVHYEAGRSEEALGDIREALRTHRELEDPGGEGDALRVLSAVQRDLGRPQNALRSAEAAVEIAVTHRNPRWEGYWLLEMGKAQQATWQFDEALVSYHRAATLQRRLGDLSREARAWHGTGETHRQLQRYDEALSFQRSAASTHRDLGDQWHLALSLDGLATALHGTGRGEPARQYWGEALHALATFDDPRAEELRGRIHGALRMT